jgi:hypothetical protein
MAFFGDRRPLKPLETVLARRVFRASLPYDKVFIASSTGFGGDPWTQYTFGQYTLHLGPIAYGDATSSAEWGGARICDIFIHELTHVWQGAHSRVHAGYQAQALGSMAWSLATTGGISGAYDYAPGNAWSSYNVEQQASIVEDWFSTGASPASPLYPYIRDQLWR